MRKLLYTLAGLSALALMASCNKEAKKEPFFYLAGDLGNPHRRAPVGPACY